MHEANKIHKEKTKDDGTKEDFFLNAPILDLEEPKPKLGIFLRVKYYLLGRPIEKQFF